MTFITDTIANFVDAENRAAMEAAGIRSILCLNGHFYDCKPEDCGVEALTCFNLQDGPGNAPWLFDRAVKIVWEYALKHPKLLVHRHSGRSRSVMVVASHQRWIFDERHDLLSHLGLRQNEAAASAASGKEAGKIEGFDEAQHVPQTEVRECGTRLYERCKLRESQPDRQGQGAR
ncbi:MAG: hypothetical protein NTY98_04760 [Verrucomicrobia bacterium]|nr:hypothetical protein [Verrucomicrobiota bacterium]